mmetsp:Transcript_58298/g.131301  ORF Transcript_58298/g.131301 Transcript_58298/m.131301 type:complete len:105 (-) Transcript_58298:82-396(-)
MEPNACLFNSEIYMGFKGGIIARGVAMRTSLSSNGSRILQEQGGTGRSMSGRSYSTPSMDTLGQGYAKHLSEGSGAAGRGHPLSLGSHGFSPFKAATGSNWLKP